MITAKCPHCQAGIRAEDRIAGRVVACPKCKNEFQMLAVAQPVPSKAVLADSVPAVAPPPIGGNSLGRVPPVEPIQIPPPPSTQAKPCPFCGEAILVAAKKCKHCGEFLDSLMSRNATQTEESDKKILPLFLLFFFFGWLGIHAFYAGQRVQGLFYLSAPIMFLIMVFVGHATTVPLLGPLGILVLLLVPIFLIGDFVRIVLGVYKDGNGRRISKWT